MRKRDYCRVNIGWQYCVRYCIEMQLVLILFYVLSVIAATSQAAFHFIR